ncbi:hypothetical protein ABVN80_08265 [Acinetobacter baumannii]
MPDSAFAIGIGLDDKSRFNKNGCCPSSIAASQPNKCLPQLLNVMQILQQQKLKWNRACRKQKYAGDTNEHQSYSCSDHGRNRTRKVRLKAQITEQGRRATITRMAQRGTITSSSCVRGCCRGSTQSAASSRLSTALTAQSRCY